MRWVNFHSIHDRAVLPTFARIDWHRIVCNYDWKPKTIGLMNSGCLNPCDRDANRQRKEYLALLANILEATTDDWQPTEA